MRLATSLICLSLIAASPVNPTPEASARAFLDSFRAMDPARFEPFFADDVTMFFPDGPFPKARVEGKAAVAAAFRSFFDLARSRGRTSLSIAPLDQKVQRHGDLAIFSFRLDSADAIGRRTIVWRKAGTQWRIIHFHASTAEK